MAKSMYQGQNLSRAPKEKSAKTSPATVLTGDTSVTIYDSRIKSSSFVRRYVEPFTDGTMLGANTMNISDGQAVITFDSPAKEDTTVVLEINDAEGFKEVTLWENPSPTSDFAAQTVTLSESISNYNYLAILYNFNHDNNSSLNSTIICSVKDFKNSLLTGNYRDIVTLSVADTSNSYSRQAYYASETSIGFTACMRVNSAYSTGNGAIPLKITGLTELNQVKIRNAKIENVLWTNSAPTSSFAAQTVTLSDDINNYDYLMFVYKGWSTNTDLMSAIYSIEDVKKSVSGSSTNHSVMSMSGNYTDGSTFSRRVFYATDTTIAFNTSWQLNGTNSGTGSNVPVQIIGIKEVSTHKVDIYGAAQDTIYYSTNGTDWTVVGQTDSNGYLANAVLPDTAFILKSSVAKNPEDLTADYTKAFNTDSNVLKFMPDNCLYWYGYMSPNAEETSPANGWTLFSGYSFVAPTYSTNKFNLTTVSTTSGNTQSGIGSKNKTHNASRLYAITQGKTIAGTRYGELMDNSVKELVNDVEITTNTIAKSQANISGDSYVVVMTNAARSIDVYALWYE